MKYSLRSLMTCTAGGVIVGWGIAALIRATLMEWQVSVPPSFAAALMIGLFGGGMVAGGVAGAWLATKLGRGTM